MLGQTWEVNIGKVYTTLQRLERDGLVQPVGARGDRGKLQYELSPRGRQALDAWIAEPESGPQQLHEEIYVTLLVASRLANGGARPPFHPPQPPYPPHRPRPHHPPHPPA